MKIALFLSTLCLGFITVSSGQTSIPSNSFLVKQNQPLLFSYERIDDLLQDNIIKNAFTIQLGPTTKSYLVYCNIAFSDFQNEAIAQKIILKPSELNNKYGSKEIKMSSKPQLVMEYRANEVSEIISYDAVISKQTTWLPPVNTNFSIQFTLIQP